MDHLENNYKDHIIHHHEDIIGGLVRCTITTKVYYGNFSGGDQSPELRTFSDKPTSSETIEDCRIRLQEQAKEFIDKISRIENFLKLNLLNIQVNVFQLDEVGYCLQAKGENINCNLIFTEEFLEDRREKELAQYLEENKNLILNQIQGGKEKIKVTNLGIK